MEKTTEKPAVNADGPKNKDDRPFSPDTPHSIINMLQHPDPDQRPGDPRDVAKPLTKKEQAAADKA